MSNNKTGQPKAYIHDDAWGMMTNDSARRLLHAQNILIAKDANNPPTVKQYTSFNLYYTESDTPSADTSNTLYPKDNLITYLSYKTIYEDGGDRAFTWNTGQFPVMANSKTYYLYCYGVDSTYANKGKGLYGVTETAPTYSEVYGGWYVSLVISGTTTLCKVLSRFKTSGAGVVQETMIYKGKCEDTGYIQYKTITQSTSSLIIDKLKCDINGQMIEYIEDVTALNAGIGASTWYALCISEILGDVQIKTLASFDNWSGTASGNQLNCITYYDEDLKYMRDVDGANGYFRILAPAKSNSTSNGYDYIKPTNNKPQTYIEVSSNAGNTLNNNTLSIVDYEDIAIDINSEWTTGANAKMTSKTCQILWGDFCVGLQSNAGWALSEVLQVRLYKNGVIATNAQEWIGQVVAGVTITPRIRAPFHCIVSTNDYIDFRAYQNNGANIAYDVTPTIQNAIIQGYSE